MTTTTHGHHIPGTLPNKPIDPHCKGIGVCDSCSVEEIQHMMETIVANPPTFWNGLETPAFRGSAVVANSDRHPLYWARGEGVVGTRIPVVMVILDGVNKGGGVTYLDNRNGSGWRKVTEGKGMPNFGHKTVYVTENSFVLSG